MEGVGSRQSRASSRYASGPSPPVFSGRVRKWKKQWVTSSASLTNGGARRNNNDAPPLLLCRWTPLSAADEPPSRRFRYAPVVPIVKGEKKRDEEARNQSTNYGPTSEMRSESSGGGGVVAVETPQEVNEEEEESNKSEGVAAAAVAVRTVAVRRDY